MPKEVPDFGAMLGQVEPSATAAPATTAKRTRRTRAAQAPAGMPAQQDRARAFDQRLNLMLDADMITALREARAADGIEATARIRAMIWHWQNDPKFRAKVDKKAAERGIRGSSRDHARQG